MTMTATTIMMTMITQTSYIDDDKDDDDDYNHGDDGVDIVKNDVFLVADVR